MADDFTNADYGRGLGPKAQLLASVKSGEYLSSARLRDVKVHTYGDTAVVTFF
jgi:hypothetical protein